MAWDIGEAAVFISPSVLSRVQIMTSALDIPQSFIFMTGGDMFIEPFWTE